MGTLLALLGIFYQCDVAIAEYGAAPMGYETCMAAAEGVSESFLTEAERARRAEAGALGALDLYVVGQRRFRAWEAEHEALVRRLRFEARAKVLGDETA